LSRLDLIKMKTRKITFSAWTPGGCLTECLEMTGFTWTIVMPRMPHVKTPYHHILAYIRYTCVRKSYFVSEIFGKCSR